MADRAPLVPAAGRLPVVLIVLASAALVAGLAAIVWHGTTTPLDTAVLHVLVRHVGSVAGQGMLDLSSPAIPIVALAVVATAAWRTSRCDLALLAIAGPSLALALTELVLKPLVGRTLAPSAGSQQTASALPAAFPSGHETGVASAAVVLVFAVRLLPLRRRGRAIAALVLTCWVVLAGVGLVRLHWHYATDVLAAVAVSAVVVLSGAMTADAFTGRRDRVSSPDARSLPRTSRAA